MCVIQILCVSELFFFFSSRRRHTRFKCDWSSDVCSSDLGCEKRLDGPLMRFSHPHALPAVHLPPAHHPVTASSKHQLSTGSPGQRRDHPQMPRQAAIACPPARLALPPVAIPHHHLPPPPAPPPPAHPAPI